MEVVKYIKCTFITGFFGFKAKLYKLWAFIFESATFLPFSYREKLRKRFVCSAYDSLLKYDYLMRKNR